MEKIIELVLACSIGCGRQVSESRAQVPAISVLTMGGVALENAQPRNSVYCEPCARIGRQRFGQRFYSLRATEQQIAQRVAERVAEVARRNAVRDAVVKGCTACGTPVAYRNTVVVPGKRGRFCPRCGARQLAAPASHDETQEFLRKQNSEVLVVPVLPAEAVEVATEALTDRNGRKLAGAAKAAAVRKRGELGVLAEHQYVSSKTDREAKKLAKRQAKEARRQARQASVEPFFERVQAAAAATA